MFDDNGAHFFRSDFQVHTPRDTNWEGARTVTEAERDVYAKKFVAACRERALDAVAITDHHDFVLFPYIKRAAANERDEAGALLPRNERLIVFPGLELTLGIPCQAILMLDAEFPEDRLQSVLDVLGVDAAPADASRLPPVVRLDKLDDFTELYGLFDARAWLKGRYIILPNLTDGGHGGLMRKGMQTKYKSMPCVGGYLDGVVEDKVGTGNRRIFDGSDPNWGNLRVALFQTSDSRSETFHELGKNSSWVKWAEPTAEAIRQACLAQDSRISQRLPQLPSVYISKVTITNSKFLGPIVLALNPQYNALIGGRGTGKSTVLDYIRWAVCDQPSGMDTDDVANPLIRRQRLIEGTLKSVGGVVEVHFTINDISHVVRRSAEDGKSLLKVGDGEMEEASEHDVRALLPIHAYSQKQLSSVSVRVDELNRFITAPIRTNLDDIDRAVEETAGRLRENYATLQRYRDLTAGAARSVLLDKSLADQAGNLRKSLTGLSEDDRRRLNERPAVENTRRASRTWEERIDTSIEQAENATGKIEAYLAGFLPVPEAPSDLAETSEAVRVTSQAVLQTLATTIAEAVAHARDELAIDSELYLGRSALAALLTSQDDGYEDVKARSSAHEAKLAELNGIEQRRVRAADLLVEQQHEVQGLGNPLTVHAQLRSELTHLYGERSDRLDSQCREVTTMSDGLLSAEMRRGHGLKDVGAKFRAVTAGSGVRSSRFDDVFTKIGTDSDPLATWESVLGELEVLLLAAPDEEVPSERTPNLTRLGMPEADQRRIQKKLTTDGWLDLALTPIADEPVFKYQTKECEYISFEQASAGQQATALLRVLLAQTGMPLIIDQPEEDLDSQVIQDVVTQLWKAKRGRQVIFASHNANLVVNGDAELVVVCEYRTSGDQSGGQIKLQGAIDMPQIREAITHIMEGGEKAFKLRKDKYGF